MKLDRTITGGRRGKYSLILEREAEKHAADSDVGKALATLKAAGVLDDSVVGTPGEFFVIRLKDTYAAHALTAYAGEALNYDPEYALEIARMADRAGVNHPNCKSPD